MTAAVTVAHGGPDVTEVHTAWPRPAITEGEALVRVTAAALNNTDIWSRQGAYGTPDDPNAIAAWRGVPLDFPRIQGIDIAGVVDAVGDAGDQDWVGRRVIVDPTARYAGDFAAEIAGSEVDGGFAQYHRCSVDQLRDVSASPLTDAQLSCLPTAYGTALGMINRAQCAAGERVLVTGSSGGVGSAALQLLLARDCHVIAHTSRSKAEQIAATGVAEVSIRGPGGLAAVAEVDAVVDVVGGEEFGELLDRLRDGGRLVTAGAIAGPVVPFDIRRLYLRQRTLIGSTMHTPADFDDLAAAANNGSVDPLVASVQPLTSIHAAQRQFVEKDFVGKIVLDPWA